MDPDDRPDAENPGTGRPPGISAFGDQRVRVPGATLTGLPDAPPLPDDSGALPRRGQTPDAQPNGAHGTGLPSRDQSPYGSAPIPLPPPASTFGTAEPASGSPGDLPARQPYGSPATPGDLPSRQPFGSAQPAAGSNPGDLPSRQPFGGPAAPSDRPPFGGPTAQGDQPVPRPPFGAPVSGGSAFGQPAPGSQVYGQHQSDGRPVSGARSYGEPTSAGAQPGAGGESADQPPMPAHSPFGGQRHGEPTPFDGRPGDQAGDSSSAGRPTAAGPNPYGAPAQPFADSPFGARPAPQSGPGRPGDADQRSAFERPAPDRPSFERHDANRPSFDRPDQTNPASSDRPVFGRSDPGQPGAQSGPGGQPGQPAYVPPGTSGGAPTGPGSNAFDEQPSFGQARAPGSTSPSSSAFGEPGTPPAGPGSPAAPTGPGSSGFAQRIPGASLGAVPVAEPGHASVPHPRDPADRPATGTARPASASASVPMASRVAPVTPDEIPPPQAAKPARVYGRAATPPSETDSDSEPPGSPPATEGRPGTEGAWPWDAKRAPEAQQPPAPAPQSPARVAGRASASARVSPPGQDAPPGGPPFSELTTDVSGRSQSPGTPGAQGRATPPELYRENTTDVAGRGRPGDPGSDGQPYVPAPALPSMHAAPQLVDGFPPPSQQPAPPGIEGDRPRMGGVFPGPATRGTVTPPPGPDETASWPSRGDQPEADQGRFDQFKPEIDVTTPAKPEPATPHVRMIPVILGVIIGAALLVGLAFGLVYLISGDSEHGFSVSAGECVKQDGDEAVKVSCNEAGAFEVVSIADAKEQCADQGQPYVINPTSDGRSQVLCLKPRG